LHVVNLSKIKGGSNLRPRVPFAVPKTKQDSAAMTTVQTCKLPPSLVTCGQALNMRVALGNRGIGRRVKTIRKSPPNVNFTLISNESVGNREPYIAIGLRGRSAHASGHQRARCPVGGH
jgi:hypothetical protein